MVLGVNELVGYRCWPPCSGADSFDPFMATNGVLGGLVAITASSPMVDTEASFVIGVVSGAIVFYGSRWLLRMKVMSLSWPWRHPPCLRSALWVTWTGDRRVVFSLVELVALDMVRWCRLGRRGTWTGVSRLWCIILGSSCRVPSPALVLSGLISLTRSLDEAYADGVVYDLRRASRWTLCKLYMIDAGGFPGGGL